MDITVKLIGAFRVGRFKEEIRSCPSGTRVEEIAGTLRIPTRVIGTVLINGVHARFDNVLKDGDRLSFLPILGGG